MSRQERRETTADRCSAKKERSRGRSRTTRWNAVLLLTLVVAASSGAHELIDTGGGTLSGASDVAVDPIQQFIYIVDTDNHRIQVYIDSTTIESTWQAGSQGSGDGELESPAGITVDSDGHIYVADTGNDRILRFSPAVFLDTTDSIVMEDVFTEASLGISMDEPHGLGVDADDRIYIADTGGGRVRVLSGGGWVGDVGDGPGDEAGSFVAPIDIAVCPLDGHIYVLDRDRPSVQIFTAFDDGAEFVRAFGVEEGDAPGFLDSPTGIALDGRCTVYVADTGNDRAQVFDRDGGVIQTFGGVIMSSPSSVAVDLVTPNGMVYVTNAGSDQFQVYEWVDFDVNGDNTIDSDGDSLPDIWEQDGVDYNGDGDVDFDLPALGADADRKDVFVELDFMTGRDVDQAGIDAVIAAFADSPVDNPDGSTGITLHVAIDDETPYTDRLIMWDEYDALKAAFFGTAAERSAANADDLLAAKRLVYHYAINADLLCGAIDNATPPNCTDVSGLGGLSDFGPNFVTTVGSKLNADSIGRAFMHELGHNLGLLHGGGDGINCKPNYLSIMNYLYAGANAFQDYDTGSNILDYSRAQLPQLEEDALTEGDGVGDDTLRVIWSYAPSILKNGPGNAALDWDNSGAIDGSTVEVDLSAAPVRECDVDDADYPNYQTLIGHDDWSSLDYNFRNNSGFYFDAFHDDFAEPDDFPIDELDDLGHCIEFGFCELPPFEYSPKLICGFQRDRADMRLVPGAYATTVNIHNPNEEDVDFFVKLALAIPPDEAAPGEILPLDTFRLAYDEAMSVGCNVITAELFDGELPASYIDGFLVIQSQASLDVTGVYSLAGLEESGRPTTPGDMEIVTIGERFREPEPEADLEVIKRASVEGFSVDTGVVAYTVLVINSGPEAAEDVVIQDRLTMDRSVLSFIVPPSSFTSTHGTGWSVVSQDAASVLLEATIDALASGEVARLEFNVVLTINPQARLAELINVVELQGDWPDPNLENNSDTLTTVIELGR